MGNSRGNSSGFRNSGNSGNKTTFWPELQDLKLKHEHLTQEHKTIKALMLGYKEEAKQLRKKIRQMEQQEVAKLDHEVEIKLAYDRTVEKFGPAFEQLAVSEVAELNDEISSITDDYDHEFDLNIDDGQLPQSIFLPTPASQAWAKWS